MRARGQEVGVGEAEETPDPESQIPNPRVKSKKPKVRSTKPRGAYLTIRRRRRNWSLVIVHCSGFLHRTDGTEGGAGDALKVQQAVGSVGVSWAQAVLLSVVEIPEESQPHEAPLAH